jgi:hypothetical protein
MNRSKKNVASCQLYFKDMLKYVYMSKFWYVKIRLHEQVLRPMRNANCRKCKKKGMGWKRNVGQNSQEVQEYGLVTCDWSEDGGRRVLRNADKCVTIYTVSEHHNTDLCHSEHHKASSREQNAISSVKILTLFCIISNKCTNISQIITFLHVLTLSCHPQTACNKHVAK